MSHKVSTIFSHLLDLAGCRATCSFILVHLLFTLSNCELDMVNDDESGCSNRKKGSWRIESKSEEEEKEKEKEKEKCRGIQIPN